MFQSRDFTVACECSSLVCLCVSLCVIDNEPVFICSVGSASSSIRTVSHADDDLPACCCRSRSTLESHAANASASKKNERTKENSFYNACIQQFLPAVDHHTTRRNHNVHLSTRASLLWFYISIICISRVVQSRSMNDSFRKSSSH